MVCPNGKAFHFYECESCESCQYKEECCPKAFQNRTIRMNQELTAIHQEVVTNFGTIHGALLRMNRSIRAERAFGVLKWKSHTKDCLGEERKTLFSN
ncbi:MAG: transposase [Blautia producta]|uniref:transposase n=1 Tax=Blautia producta TaxID=33035 RepID=UPI0027D44C92|nr:MULTISPECIES: transposase [Blautia]MDU5220856.1 transposase [Blautia producta]MDU5385547.1 transposase [Blautia producta]MDU6885788.1 transposase [Blautia producta]